MKLKLLLFTLCISFGLYAQQKQTGWLNGLSQEKRNSPSIKKEDTSPKNNCQTFTNFLLNGVQVDSAVCQEYDSTANALVNSEMEVTIYDANGWVNEDYVYYWDGSAWVYDEKSSFTYDGNGYVILEEGYYWDGSSWLNEYKDSLIYDSNGNEILSISFYSSNGLDWEYGSKDSMVYNTNNLIQEENNFYWSGFIWENSSRILYSYDSNNYLEEYIYYYWYVSTWYESSRNLYTYDLNGNMLSYTYYYWTGSSWTESYLVNYTYDSFNQEIADTSYYWDGSEWGLSGVGSTSYDNDGNKIEEIYFGGFNPYDSTWGYGGMYTYTYDSNGNITEGYEYNWVDTAFVNDFKYEVVYTGSLVEFYMYVWDGSNWDLFRYCYANYNPFASIVEANMQKAVSFYPNPINNEAILHISNFNNEEMVLTIYNSQGKMVKKQNINSENSRFSRNELTSGMYFYQLNRNENTVVSDKLVIK